MSGDYRPDDRLQPDWSKWKKESLTPEQARLLEAEIGKARDFFRELEDWKSRAEAAERRNAELAAALERLEADHLKAGCAAMAAIETWPADATVRSFREWAESQVEAARKEGAIAAIWGLTLYALRGTGLYPRAVEYKKAVESGEVAPWKKQPEALEGK